MPPQRRALRRPRVLHVQHIILEVFIEDTRLNLKAGLLRLQRSLKPQQRGGRMRRDVQRVEQRKGQCADRGNRDHAHKLHDAEAGRARRRDLAVGRQPAEAQQHTHKHRHGDRQDQGVRHRVKEHERNRMQRRRTAHQQLKHAPQVAHEQHKGEQHTAQHRMRQHLAQNVPRQNPHDVSSASQR